MIWTIAQLTLLTVQIYSLIMVLTKHKGKITIYNVLAVGLSVPILLISSLK